MIEGSTQERTFTLDEFRQACALGISDNGRGYLTGSARPIRVGAIRWRSKYGQHEMHYDLLSPITDPVADLYEELTTKSVIIDCLVVPEMLLLTECRWDKYVVRQVLTKIAAAARKMNVAFNVAPHLRSGRSYPVTPTWASGMIVIDSMSGIPTSFHGPAWARGNKPVIITRHPSK